MLYWRVRFIMRKLHLGYGFMANVELHDSLLHMTPEEREKVELNLKKNSKKYKGFKEWQKSYMKWFPEKKINY